MKDIPNDDELMNKDEFLNHFLDGCLAFITLAALIRGEHTKVPGEILIKEIINPLAGNRNRDKIKFEDMVPDIYKKVIEYCHEAVIISDNLEEIGER